MRRCSRRTFVSCLAALTASRASVFKPQSAYAQQPAPLRRIGFLLVGCRAKAMRCGSSGRAYGRRGIPRDAMW